MFIKALFYLIFFTVFTFAIILIIMHFINFPWGAGKFFKLSIWECSEKDKDVGNCANIL